MPTIKIELFFCFFLRNSALVWSRKISAGWRWTGRVRWSKWPGAPLKSAFCAHLGMVPAGAVKEPGDRKGSGAAQNLSHRAFLGNAGHSGVFTQGLLLNQGSNSPFPPAPASAATSNICRDVEGQAWHYSPFPGEEKVGEAPKGPFHPHRGEFKLSCLPLENKPSCRSPLT